MPPKACIAGMVARHAPRVITTEAIEDRIASTLERIEVLPGRFEQLTGIRERRYWNPGVCLYDEATEAARAVIEASGVDPQEIGCLINTSVCRDFLEPSQASMIHGNLGLSDDCIHFDISNACLGFVNGLDTVRLYIESGAIKHGLVVTAEGSPKALEATMELLEREGCTIDDYMRNMAMLTIGCGAVAMLLSRDDVAADGHCINGSVTMTGTTGGRNKLCVARVDHSGMVADAHGLMIHGVELAARTWRKALSLLPRWHDDTIDLYTPHQTSTRQIGAFVEACHLSADKMHICLQTLGNVASAALPLALVDAWELGRLRSGYHVGLIGIGSGLNCTMMSVTW